MTRIRNPADPLLVVDDESSFLRSIEIRLRLAGVSNLITCADSRDALSLLRRGRPSAVLLDLHMPFISGWELMRIIVQEWPEVPVVVITANDEIDAVVRAIKAGAVDYLVKPLEEEHLLTLLTRLFEESDARRRDREAATRASASGEQLARPEAFAAIITTNPRMIEIFHYVEAVARTAFPVLITGETGTGKELVARALHQVSGRSGQFVAVNVAGLEDTLFSDALFGHRKGAFTGADSDRKGLIARATGGTLFLDEVGDLALESQIRLLRLLQEGVYYALGADQPLTSDARIVFATNRDLKAKTKEGQFRLDLYYRLQSHHIDIPPLRERVDDLPLLVDHFVASSAEKAGVAPPEVPQALTELLRRYDFPGNVRELEGMVNDALVRHRSGPLELDRFKGAVFERVSEGVPRSGSARGAAEAPAPGGPLFESFPSLPELKVAEAELVAEALRRAHGNQTLAAQTLGITRQALNNRLRRSRAARPS